MQGSWRMLQQGGRGDTWMDCLDVRSACKGAQSLAGLVAPHRMAIVRAVLPLTSTSARSDGASSSRSWAVSGDHLLRPGSCNVASTAAPAATRAWMAASQPPSAAACSAVKLLLLLLAGKVSWGASAPGALLASSRRRAVTPSPASNALNRGYGLTSMASCVKAADKGRLGAAAGCSARSGSVAAAAPKAAHSGGPNSSSSHPHAPDQSERRQAVTDASSGGQRSGRGASVQRHARRSAKLDCTRV